MKGDDEAKSDPFWADGREMLRRAEEEAGPLTLEELEARYAASAEPAERTRLRQLIDRLRRGLAQGPEDERLF